MQAAVKKALDAQPRVHRLLTDEIPDLLDDLVALRTKTETVAGYKVTVQMNALGAGERQGRRRSTLRDIIAQSLGHYGTLKSGGYRLRWTIWVAVAIFYGLARINT